MTTTTTKLPVLAAVKLALAASLCIVPPAEDGSKKPNEGKRWKEFQSRKPTVAELNRWYGGDQPKAGMGLILGAISGNVECLDFDDGPTWRAFLRYAPKHLRKLILRIRRGYEEATPAPGRRHLLYRIDGKPVPGSTKLASGPADPETGERPTLIETKGEGGYVITAPTSASVHPDYPRPWRLIMGGFDTIATITADEHDALMAYCRTFDRSDTEQRVSTNVDTRPMGHSDDERPGVRFNRDTTAGAFVQMLLADGWQLPASERDRVDSNERHYVVRPGKDPAAGSSANVKAGPDGIPVLYVHSTSAPIPANEKGTGYKPFSYLCETRGGTLGAFDYLRHHGYLDTASGAQERLERDLDAASTPGRTAPASDPPEVEPLEVRTITAALNDTTPAPPELVAGLIVQGEGTVIGAPRGIGKSFLGMQLALMLAAGDGHLFGRHRIMRPRRVLYAHGELDPFSARKRWRRMLHSAHWLLTTSGDPTAPEGLSETFVQWRIDLRRVRTTTTAAGIQTATDTVVATVDPRLEERIRQDGTQVLILDPWASYHGGNENSNDDTEAVLAELRRLALTYGLTVVIVHHVGKKQDVRDPEDLWRGASRLADWASNRITLTEHYNDKQADKQGMTRKQARKYLDVRYLRRGAPVDDHCIRRDDDGWWHDWVDGTPTTVHTHTVRDLIDVLAEHGEFKSKKKLRAHLGIGSPDTLERLLDEAGDSIDVDDQGAGRGTRIRLAEGGVSRGVTPHLSPAPPTGSTPPLTSTFGVSPGEPVATPPDTPSDLPKRNLSPVTPTGSESPRPEAGGDTPAATPPTTTNGTDDVLII